MPKMKTKRALAKRVKKNKNGSLKRGHAYRGHLALNKSTKQKRHLEKSGVVSQSDAKRLKGLLQN